MRKKLIAKWTLVSLVVLALLTIYVLPLFSRSARTFQVAGRRVGLLAVPEWGFGTTSYPGYAPLTKQYGSVQVHRHGLYAIIGFGGKRPPTPDEQAETL